MTTLSEKSSGYLLALRDQIDEEIQRRRDRAFPPRPIETTPRIEEITAWLDVQGLTGEEMWAMDAWLMSRIDQRLEECSRGLRRWT